MIERLRRLRGEAGYNLVEMITVMVIMTVVFAGITTVFVAGSKAQSDQERRFQAQVTTRLALDKIRRDIHCSSDVTPFATTLQVDFNVSVTGTSVGAYDLTDTIFLRNSTRI